MSDVCMWLNVCSTVCVWTPGRIADASANANGNPNQDENIKHKDKYRLNKLNKMHLYYN